MEGYVMLHIQMEQIMLKALSIFLLQLFTARFHFVVWTTSAILTTSVIVFNKTEGKIRLLVL